jgi:hypothetical protein
MSRHTIGALALRAVIAAECAATIACTDDVTDDAAETADVAQSISNAPVGLAVEVDNGAGVALKLKKGQTYYLNQIDLRASITATVDEGVNGLRSQGDFANMPWIGNHLDDQEFILLSNADGTFRRRRFFRDALWMNIPSFFVLEQVDAKGRSVGDSVFANAGTDGERRASDDFFDRRFRAIQWTNDCHTSSDCTGATNFEEEALVELRYGMHPNRTFDLKPTTVALRLYWSNHPSPYTIPVQQIDNPPFAYGFQIDVAAVTPPRADGTYAPGSDITFRATLRDGAGNRLHPEGAMPSYNEVVFGANPAGIQYYRAFFDPTTTYWRRKHRERMLMAQLIGPAQNIQPIRSIIDLDKFLNEDDVQVTGTLEADGVYSEFHTFPTAHDLFGGAFDPVHAGWAVPVADTWTHHIPANAPSGTYLLTMKGRRTYMGEDIPYTRTIEIQVGSPTHTEATLNTGPCATCHSGESSLSKVLHANARREACAGCHVPLGFELEGPIYVRTHFIHSRSRRFDAPLDNCSSCHLTAQSIQRTSKSACLSCHKSYPQSHIDMFGPIESMYVGGGRESFQQCTSSCHQTHPNSNL